TCLDRSVEAIIVIAAQEDVVRQVPMFAVDVPLIVVGPPQSHLPGLSTFSVDQRQGAKDAIAHLGELGHRRILVLTGPGRWIDAQERRTGALDECEARGIAAEVVAGDWSPASGYEAGRALADRADGVPTAIFSANDAMALGLLAAFNEAGVTAPDDVSLIGFDDIAEAADFSPARTTVQQDCPTPGHRVVGAGAPLAGRRAPCARRRLAQRLRRPPGGGLLQARPHDRPSGLRHARASGARGRGGAAGRSATGYVRSAAGPVGAQLDSAAS